MKGLFRKISAAVMVASLLLGVLAVPPQGAQAASRKKCGSIPVCFPNECITENEKQQHPLQPVVE